MTFVPPGVSEVGAWARRAGLSFEARPLPDWYRRWEPFDVLVAPERYFGAVGYALGSSAVAIAEPWPSEGEAEPLGRDLLAFVADARFSFRAAARVGPGTHLTRVSFLTSAKPTEQTTGDTEWDHVAVTYARTPLDAVRGVGPSLRKLLLGWNFQGHIEVRPGGMIVHAAGIEPTPRGYETLRAWLPPIVEKALKG